MVHSHIGLHTLRW